MALFTRTTRPRKPRPVMPAPSGLHAPRDIIIAEGPQARRVFCGPWVVMALTGRPSAEVVAAFNRLRGKPADKLVKGTTTHEVRQVLQGFGVKTGDWDCVYHKRITLASWLRDRTAEGTKDTWVVLGAHHFTLVQGDRATCAVAGHWTKTSAIPKRRGVLAYVMRIPTETLSMAQPFLLAPWPYVGDGLGREPRFPSLEAAEKAAREQVKRNGNWLNIVQEQESGRVILAKVSRDHGGNTWTDVEGAGTRLL